MKPVAIGQTSQDGIEFGDIYHLAVALILSPDLEYVFVGSKQKHSKFIMFLKSFRNPKEIIPYDSYLTKRSNYKKIGCTADIFLNHEHDHEKLAIISNKFLEKIKIKNSINSFAKNICSNDPSTKKVLLWVRNEKYDRERNITSLGVFQLLCTLQDLSYKPILIGRPIGFYKENDDNLINFFKKPLFEEESFFTQLAIFKVLKDDYNVKFSIGMMSGAMDGPAFALNLPTFYFAKDDDNRRMSKVTRVFNQFTHVNLSGAKQKKFISFNDEELREVINLTRDIV